MLHSVHTTLLLSGPLLDLSPTAVRLYTALSLSLSLSLSYRIDLSYSSPDLCFLSIYVVVHKVQLKTLSRSLYISLSSLSGAAAGFTQTLSSHISLSALVSFAARAPASTPRTAALVAAGAPHRSRRALPSRFPPDRTPRTRINDRRPVQSFTAPSSWQLSQRDR